jgi:hypothetical protein
MLNENLTRAPLNLKVRLSYLHILGQSEASIMKKLPLAKAASQVPPLTFHSVTMIIAAAGTLNSLHLLKPA